jgi:polyisoprenyl-phosphate glycosyltransferase
MKLISIVTPCYNEQDNIEELYNRVKNVFSEMPEYHYEHIFIDNNSSDQTVKILKLIAQHDTNVKLIINLRNFGHIRSPYHALLQAKGDAVVSLVADLQDPPEMIKSFIEKWQTGYNVAIGVKTQSQESRTMFMIRKFYYKLVSRISDIHLIKDFTGFGLYDQKVINILRGLEEPYPYFRGLIAELGFEIAIIPYHQPVRKKGITKNNFYTLYDLAMLGITNHSTVPVRLATMFGFLFSCIGFSISIIYFLMKLFFWNKFNLGVAPVLIGVFFFSSVQLFFIGILGEYIISLQTRITNRPLVIEKERVNFN